jgi:Uma2 family endonuclease
MRRYEAMPEVKKAELIHGVVYMGSPVRGNMHGAPHTIVMTWVGTYWSATPGTIGYDNSTLCLAEKERPQPDALLMIKQDHGGNARMDEDGYVEGSPEFAAEIAAERSNLELHDKLEAYRDHGIREYLIWRVSDDEVDWFALRRKRYVRLRPDKQGILRSQVFPGLWLNVPALSTLDIHAVLVTLQQGLASPEHAAFVKRLQS